MLDVDHSKLFKTLEERNISIVEFARITGIPKVTLYGMRRNRFTVGAEKCMIIADALNMPVSELFPYILEKKAETVDIKEYNDTDVTKLKDVVIEKKENNMTETKETKGITSLDNMIPGAALLSSEDGVTIKVRMVMTQLNERFDGINVPTNTQILIFTGVKASTFDFNKTMVKTSFKLVRENEFYLLPFAYDFDSEVVVIGHCYGKDVMINRGMEIGKFICI